eukprot:sb/3468191/
MTDLLTREEREELGQERKQERKQEIEKEGEGQEREPKGEDDMNCDLKDTNGTNEGQGAITEFGNLEEEIPKSRSLTPEETPKSRNVTPDCESEDVMTLSSENATMREAVQVVDHEELKQDKEVETSDTFHKSRIEDNLVPCHLSVPGSSPSGEMYCSKALSDASSICSEMEEISLTDQTTTDDPFAAAHIDMPPIPPPISSRRDHQKQSRGSTITVGNGSVGNGSAVPPRAVDNSGARREESVRRQQQLLMSIPKSYCDTSLASEVSTF